MNHVDGIKSSQAPESPATEECKLEDSENSNSKNDENCVSEKKSG